MNQVNPFIKVLFAGIDVQQKILLDSPAESHAEKKSAEAVSLYVSLLVGGAPLLTRAEVQKIQKNLEQIVDKMKKRREDHSEAVDALLVQIGTASANISVLEN